VGDAACVARNRANIVSAVQTLAVQSSDGMMIICRKSAFPAILLVATSVALAEDAPAKLPADGWWVRYFVTTRREGTNDETIMKRTYSLVGTSTENGEKCRWIEMNSVLTINGKERKEILKFLLPEKQLLEDDRTWVCCGKDQRRSPHRRRAQTGTGC
jgi:hypothetical protein